MSARKTRKVKVSPGMSAGKFWISTLKGMLNAKSHRATVAIAVPGLEVEVDIYIRRMKNLATGEVVEIPAGQS